MTKQKNLTGVPGGLASLSSKGRPAVAANKLLAGLIGRIASPTLNRGLVSDLPSASKSAELGGSAEQSAKLPNDGKRAKK